MARPKKTDYEKTVVDLYRELLCTVNLDDVKLVDGLKGEEYRDFCRFCHEVVNNPMFQLIIKNFIHAQVMMTAEKASDYETYMAGKMVVNGIKVIEEYFIRYANKYQVEFLSDKEDFDPLKAFQAFQPPRRANYEQV
jgi:hypothetical protein